MSAIRDRSVVRSSVIPSAKYCCSGSLLRFAKGRTTIDSRGADFASMLAAGCVAVEGAWVVTAGGRCQGHAHHAAVPIAAAVSITTAATRPLTPIRRRLDRVGNAATPTA